MKSPVHIADRCGDRGDGVLREGLPTRGMGGVGRAGDTLCLYVFTGKLGT